MNLKQITLPLILSLSFLFVACSESTQAPNNEGIDSQIEEAGEDAGNALEETGENAGKALEDAQSATEEGLNDAGNAVTEGIGEAGSAIEEAGDAVEDATN